MDVYEKIKKVREASKKKYLYISPYTIEGGAKLVVDSDTLDLYENMDKNTDDFAEKEIVNLIAKAEAKNGSLSKILEFNLVLLKNFDELPKMSNIDLIKNNLDKIVAIVKYDSPKKTTNDFYHSGDSQNNNFIYLNFKKLLDSFREHNLEFDIIEDTNSFYSIDKKTGIKISYDPKKYINENTHKVYVKK